MADKEIFLAKNDELKDGEMKVVKIDDREILLARYKGEYYAVAPKCTHYGGPLVEGDLSGTRLMCPWHHATFDIMSGKMLEPPALDGLPAYKIRIEKDNILVTIPEGEVPSKQVCRMSHLEIENDDSCFVIVGAGAAGNMAAQTLRENGYRGRIIMLTKEQDLPYDRPELSKGYLGGHAKEEWLPLRDPVFYKRCNIEIMPGREVISINTETRMLTLNTSEAITYDSLLLATGSIPRKLHMPKADLANIYTVRSRADIRTIIGQLDKAEKAAVIGASFIAIETSAALKERGKEVTVIAPESIPFERILGKDVGMFFKQLHESHGVNFKLGEGVQGFEGDDKVKSVVLDSGKKIPADLVIVGIGVEPATKFKMDIPFESDGGIKVDQYFQVKDRIFAAGDIAKFPYWRTGEDIRIEHWRVAEQQGRLAALNMLDKKISYSSVPFFWTQLFGVSFCYVGYAKDWDNIIIDGDIAKGDFIAYYSRKNKVLAAAGVNRDKEMAAIEDAIRTNKIPAANKLGSKITAKILSR
jgi:apoptosis-inducing factor 3